MGPTLKQNSITFSTEKSGDPFIVNADEQRLTQAILNLIENAANALKKQASGLINLQIGESLESWQIEVKDNGPGIPLEAIPFIFKRFYRVEKNRSRETGGVGLGLSIVKGIIDGHQGRVTCTSKIGSDRRPGGTQINITLPKNPQEMKSEHFLYEFLKIPRYLE